ncbi:MAG TPA: hypothetical protein VK667_02585, partial [Ktedonobacteraceae bacterium]|nr:hypothetical protein [Ktedonobacteraceae bacterium]
MGQQIPSSLNSNSRLLQLARIPSHFLVHIPDLLISIVSQLTMVGLIPLLVGALLLRFGLTKAEIIPFLLGLSLLLLGSGLLVKTAITQVIMFMARFRSKEQTRKKQDWYKVANSVFAALAGSALVAYWALPFDALARLGLPRFRAGIEVFFVAGMMMVLGSAWALISNAGLFVSPLLALCARLPGLCYTLAKLVFAYPLHQRFRTGLNLVMFSLVIFAMTVMSVITNAMQNTYVDINTQTGGYDIQATPYFKSLPDLHTSLAEHGIDPHAFSTVGVRNTNVVGVIQLSAPSPRWYIYPAQIIDGGFLQGYGLHLMARASGFSSDSAIWQALQSHPDYALIDSNALSYSQNATNNSAIYDPTVPQRNGIPPGFDANITFAISGVSPGEKVFPATPVWVADTQGRQAMKLTIIGVVDNSDSAHFGLYIPHSRYSSAALGVGGDLVTDTTQGAGGNGVTDVILGAGGDAVTSTDRSYYFKVAPGQDKRALALKLGSAFLDYGLETTVLEDA